MSDEKAVCRGCGRQLDGAPHYTGKRAYLPENGLEALSHHFGGWVCSARCEKGGAMAIHVYDGDSWHKVADIDSAKKACSEAIGTAREVAKYRNEWPDWVESIRAYEAPDDTENPEEFTCILNTVETNVKRPSSKLDEEGFDDNGDWWPDSDACNCDYDVEEIHYAK